MDRAGDRPSGDRTSRAWLGDGRFEVRARLGSGASGSVYRAHDHETGHEVAIKVLRAPTPDALYRLKTEFRALTDVRHPNLVRLHELIEHAGTWMITMELVLGVDFVSWVRPHDVLDEARLGHAAIELARGLEALHHAGYLHRDIKPSNVMVSERGRVVLLDGGLVAPLVGGRQDGDVIAAGTLAYMAPEQGAGRRLTPKSDWYAAGALLFHAITGRPPFTGEAVEVISAKLMGEPARPSTIAANLSPELDQLCVDLLRRRPRQRPSGREVIRRLGGASDDELELADGSGDIPLPIVGRDAELDQLAALIGPGWEPRVVAVIGAAGVGKTALVREAVRRLELRDASTWAVWNRTQHHAEIALRGLDGLVDELARRLRRLAPAHRHDLIPPGSARLAVRFPVFGELLDASSFDDTLDDADDDTSDAAALRAVLSKIGVERPLVLVLDDAHLATPAALRLLRAALDGEPAPRVAIVACGRDDGGWWSADSLMPTATIRIAELAGEDAIVVAGQRVVPEDAAALAASCGGHPALMIEVARKAIDVRVWYAQRRARMSDEARAAIDVIAHAGVGIAPATVARAADVDVDEMTIDELVAAMVVRVTADGRLWPYHDRVAAAVRSLIDEHRRRELDVAIAGALGDAGDYLAAAHLWRDAGEPERARDDAVRAAGAAVGVGRLDDAIAAYALAVDVDSDGRVHAALADVLAWSGRIDEAVRAYLASAERASQRRAFDARRRAAELLFHDGQVDDGARLLAAVLEDLGIPAVMTGDERDAMIAETREAGGAAIDPLAAARIDAVWTAATAWSEIDPRRAARYRGLFVDLARAAGDPRRQARALAIRAVDATARCDADGGELWSAALAIAERVGLAEDPAFTATPRASLALVRGDFAAAAGALDRSIAAHRERAGSVAGAPAAAAVAAGLCCRAHLGDLDAIGATIASLRRDAERDRLVAIELGIGGGALLTLAAGDPEAVLAAVERAAAWPTRGFTALTHQRVWAEWHARVYRGDFVGSHAALDAIWLPARRAGATRIAVVRLDLLRMRALSRLALGDVDGALADRDRIARIPVAVAAAAIAAIDAAVSGDAIAWRSASDQLTAHGLALHAAAARWRAARAAGDADTAAVIEHQLGPRVADPPRLLAMLAPARSVSQ